MKSRKLGFSLVLFGGLYLLAALLLVNCGSSSGGGDPNATGALPSTPAVICVDPGTAPAGQTYYLDPVSGSLAGDGSAASPWGSLQELIENNMIETRAYANLPYDGTNPLEIKNPGAPVKAGDTLVLRDGYHGEFNLRGAYNEYPITIKAASGQQPTLSRIFVSAASNWRFEGLTITLSAAPVYATDTLVRVESHGWHGPSSNVVIKDCEIYSVADSTSWSIDDWNNLAGNAISVSGDCVTIQNNQCRNVNFGISVDGNSSLVSGNTVENFAGDGMRGLGNDLVFEYNLVKNCYDVNANHDDGFQSWSIDDDPPRERVVLRGNTIISYEDPNQPFRGDLQGIGCFDGPYKDWVVENNLVITDAWHGISLYGAFDSRIVNNTVIDRDANTTGTPWIMVNPHKNGTPSRGCVIRNNISPSFTVTGDTLADHNYELQSTDNLFVDPTAFDYHLRSDAAAVIDQGSSELAPALDLDGISRPRGSAVDIGCYEY